MKYIKSIVGNSIHFKELENSVLFILDDGFKFFHPLSMTNFIRNNIEITYTDEWKFTLRKSEKIDDEWIGSLVSSLEKTVNKSGCQANKKKMEQLNNTHYEFGKVKGILSVNGDERVMIELVQVNE